jgi:sigma-B regulation protein RsbU (phosphoserine phosphatase)
VTHKPRRQALLQLDLETVLSVTRALAAPFDLRSMLATVTRTACGVLRAERASVWLLDEVRHELVLEVATDLSQVRLAVGTGLVGACARDGVTINVPDCYADPRFDREIDARTGFHTRCSVTLPLVDHRAQLIGVMQVLNHRGGPFGAREVRVAEALAAQCAVALSRVRMIDSQRQAERLQQELELARQVQLGTLPLSVPRVPGYDMHGTFLPASQTGGDTYDFAHTSQGLLLVLADAAGHGLAPALSVTQMHAMLRMAIRLGADLETAFRQVNDQLAETLQDGRFVNAFIGLLDPATHRLRFLSGGQGPILHFRAATCRLGPAPCHQLPDGRHAYGRAEAAGGAGPGRGRPAGPDHRRGVRVRKRPGPALRRGRRAAPSGGTCRRPGPGAGRGAAGRPAPLRR